MSLKQIYADHGVDFAIPVNQLWESWPIAMQRAETKGLVVQPVRIGSRRVALATNLKQSQKSFSIWISAALIISLTVFCFLMALPSATKSVAKSSPVKSNCMQLALGAELIDSSDGYQVGGWNLTLQSLGSSGNLSSYHFEATCAAMKDEGILLAVSDRSILRIKKLTRTDK